MFDLYLNLKTMKCEIGEISKTWKYQVKIETFFVIIKNLQFKKYVKIKNI